MRATAAPRASWRSTIALGLAQTLAWASSYYLLAILAAPIGRAFGVASAHIYAAFSVALVVAGLLGVQAGRAIDRWGGRPVLAGSSLVFAAGLLLLGTASSLHGVFLAWVVLGLAMSAGLYEGAFAALVRLHGSGARGPITGVTLIAGLASTVGWPVSSLLEQSLGWRGACLAWASMHLLLGLPLNLALPAAGPVDAAADNTAEPAAQAQDPVPAEPVPARPDRTGFWLATAFATALFIGSAMAAHLPVVLSLAGLASTQAVALAALMGPAQVVVRLLDFGLLQRVSPLWVARVAATALPVGAGLLLWSGPAMASALALLHGAGNGLLTISRGVLPVLLFGPQGYGARQARLMLPARMAQALSPFAMGACLDRWGLGALWLVIALGLAGCAALWQLRLPRSPAGSTGS